MMDTLTKELYEEVTNLLHDMGTPAHIKGHYYLRSAILEVYAHPELLKNMMNGLYATIAEAYDTTPSLCGAQYPQCRRGNAGSRGCGLSVFRVP